MNSPSGPDSYLPLCARSFGVSIRPDDSPLAQLERTALYKKFDKPVNQNQGLRLMLADQVGPSAREYHGTGYRVYWPIASWKRASRIYLIRGVSSAPRRLRGPVRRFHGRLYPDRARRLGANLRSLR